VRFLHTADLHLAKPFGRFDEDTRAALRRARLDAFRRIGALAVEHGADVVLIAGDTFDAETPPPKTINRALRAMADVPEVIWVLMPGNHDSLAAVDLWERIAQDAPPNLCLALTPEVIEIGASLAILPCPPTVRAPGMDLTAWTTTAETPGRIRLGLAHGGVVDFGSEAATPAVIPPDRAETAALDYLALGDWHGQMSLSRRTWYAGTPEPDSFKHATPAGALLVEISAPGAVPTVTPLPTGTFHWYDLSLPCLEGLDPVAQLAERLPQTARDTVLVRLTLSGRLGLADHAALHAACTALRDDFHHFEVDDAGLGIAQSVTDLDLIAEAGALRTAADTLLAATDLTGRTPEEAQIAQTALTHLFHLAQEDREP
jgi:DNA repair exonuclease SbcCD nuclease subunit